MRNWPRNDIDRFVLAGLEREGREPAREASRETLIRRVAFDLTGLPPTLKEIDAYLADESPKAYERMVDHFLDSPAYGEHMARHWLDLARYADSNGYQYDTEREQWVWRDWVIDAYNRNKPFDQFTIEQLAGDLLPNATPQQWLATGFNRNHGITIEGGIIDEEYRTEYVMDRLITTGEVWLGLTIGCARCHEHKFDPISQQEFYQLYAFFNQVPERGMRGFTPQQSIPSPLAAEQHRELDTELARLKAELRSPENIDTHLDEWAKRISSTPGSGWSVLTPLSMKSSGGTTLTPLDDDSILASGANPRHDIYDVVASTGSANLTASRYQTCVASSDSPQRARLTNARDRLAIGQSPTDSAARLSAVEGKSLDEANFATHGVGRPRLSVTGDPPETLQLNGIPADIRQLAGKARDQRSEDENTRLQEYFLAHHNPQKAVQQRITELEKQKAAAFPATMIMQDMPQPRATHILNRGQYNEPTDKVTAGVAESVNVVPCRLQIQMALRR